MSAFFTIPTERTPDASRPRADIGDAHLSKLEDILRFADTLEVIVEISPLEVLEFGTTAASIIETFRPFGFHPYSIENSYADYLRTRPIQRPRRLRSTPTSCLDAVFSRVDAEQI